MPTKNTQKKNPCKAKKLRNFFNFFLFFLRALEENRSKKKYPQKIPCKAKNNRRKKSNTNKNFKSSV